MREIIIKAGALRHMIKEDANEFRAKLGSNVERDNKSENQKAYNDTEKRMKAFNPQLKPNKKKYEKTVYLETRSVFFFFTEPSYLIYV